MPQYWDKKNVASPEARLFEHNKEKNAQNYYLTQLNNEDDTKPYKVTYDCHFPLPHNISIG